MSAWILIVPTPLSPPVGPPTTKPLRITSTVPAAFTSNAAPSVVLPSGTVEMVNVPGVDVELIVPSAPTSISTADTHVLLPLLTWKAMLPYSTPPLPDHWNGLAGVPRDLRKLRMGLRKFVGL